MTRVLIWDLPTRIFHWLFAGGFLAAAFIALGMGEDGPLFPYHAMIGLTLAVMVLLRVVWGLTGSKYARFRSFIFGPRDVVEYMRGIATGKGPRHVGHNPGSAYAIYAMLAIMLGLAATGIMLGRGNESVKELHEFLSYSMLAVIGVHVLGVVIHTVRHRENITASMIHGRKSADGAAGIRSAHPVAAAVFLLVTGVWAGGLWANYDAVTHSTVIPWLGTTLQLGGEEENADPSRRDEHEEHGDDHD